MKRPETGVLLGEFPYVRAGAGSRTLVVLPGVGDAMFGGEYPPAAGWMLRAYFARYLDTHAVYLVSRPRGLPDGHTARDSAENHARILEGVLGPADVLGISMGGLVAQELSAARPGLVERLVLANTACRLAEESRDDVERLREYALEHEWAAIRARLAGAMFSDWRAFAYPPLVVTVGRAVLPRPAVPSDVWRSLELILEYDGTAGLPDIEAPTFVFGGTRDPYFTERVVRETAEGIPDATLSLIPGAKHGAFHERKYTFDTRVSAFLGSR